MKNEITVSNIPIKEYNDLLKPRTLAFNHVEFECPLCGFINKPYTTEARLGKNEEFIYCDTESGGCDEKIILLTEVTTSIKCKAFKMPS